MKFKIKRHTDISNPSVDHISQVWVLHEDEHVALIEIDLHTKYKQIDAYGGATDGDCASVWFGTEELQISDCKIKNFHIQGSCTSRYTCWLTLWSQDLYKTEQPNCVWAGDIGGKPDDELKLHHQPGETGLVVPEEERDNEE